MNRFVKISIFSLLSMLSLNSCGELYNITNRCTSSHVNPDWDALERDLSSAEALWAAKNPPSYYKYVYNSTGFGISKKIYVEVFDSRVGAYDGFVVLPEAQAKLFGPVENLFSSLRSSIVNRSSACLTANVKYNSRLGYPESFSFSDEKEGLMDAFGGFTLTNFDLSPPIPHP